MKKNKVVDILNEVSALIMMISVPAAVITSYVSMPLFIVSLVLCGLSMAGVVATAVYNQKQFDKQVEKEKAEEAKENEKIKNMCKLQTEEKKEIPVQENIVIEKKDNNKTKKINK